MDNNKPLCTYSGIAHEDRPAIRWRPVGHREAMFYCEGCLRELPKTPYNLRENPPRAIAQQETLF